MIDAATGRRPQIEIFGTDYPTPDGTCLRDYVHVDDLSRAHIAVFDKLGEARHGAFLPQSGHRQADLQSAKSSAPSRKSPAKKCRRSIERPRRPGDPPALYADSTKAITELGWDIKFKTIEPIVATAWKWHSENPDGFKK